jgi:predicted kinase
MNKLILTRGIPASGKTYWAENFCKENDDFVNINRDDLRIATYNTYNITPKQEKNISEIQINKAIEAIASKKNIIISDTNLNPKTIQKWEEFAKNNNYALEYMDFFDTDFETCVKRDKKRSKSVGRDVILQFHNKYISPTMYKHNNTKNNVEFVYIFDIDGTLALMKDRSPYEWDKVNQDTLFKDVKRILTLLQQNFKIIIVSGRDSVCYDLTKKWLIDNGIYCDNLFMRKNNDTRPDYVVKSEIFMNNIDQQYNVLGVFDDRDCVVKMWRDFGITCFQVAYGDF